MPTRACFLVVPTTTVQLVLLTKSAQTCLSIKVWRVQQIQALRHHIAVVVLPSVQGMSLAQALQDRKRSAAPKSIQSSGLPFGQFTAGAKSGSSRGKLVHW